MPYSLSTVLAATLLLAGCASTRAQPVADLRAALGQPGFTLIGEVHDNAAVHALRAQALDQALAAGWRPALAFEQFDRERQADIDAARREAPQDVDALIARAKPAGKGWHWDFYRPLLVLALRYDLPIVAANLSRADASKVVKQGYAAALSTEQIARYRLDVGVPDALQAGQMRAIAIGHCNQLPDSLLPGMARAQIARDVVMADAIAPYRARGVVLIAGNGHVRRDLGVPHWLPEARALGLLESPEPQAYDQSWVLPRQDRPDPCAGLAAGKG